MITRTQDEIDEQIAWLKTNRSKIAPRNFFGESNHEKIDVEIEVLEQRLTEDDVLERTQFEDDEEEDDSKWPQHLGDSARDVAQWLEGNMDESPSDNWECLVKE